MGDKVSEDSLIEMPDKCVHFLMGDDWETSTTWRIRTMKIKRHESRKAKLHKHDGISVRDTAGIY